jgi:hypothetical protein
VAFFYVNIDFSNGIKDLVGSPLIAGNKKGTKDVLKS